MLLLGPHQSMCLACHADHWCCLQTPHQTLPPVKEGAQRLPKCIQRRFIAGAGHAANATHLPRKLNASSWAPDDDLYWCQWGLLPTKCLVWQAQWQLIKIHARTVYSKQGTRGSVSPDPSSPSVAPRSEALVPWVTWRCENETSMIAFVSNSYQTSKLFSFINKTNETSHVMLILKWFNLENTVSADSLIRTNFSKCFFYTSIQSKECWCLSTFLIFYQNAIYSDLFHLSMLAGNPNYCGS